MILLREEVILPDWSHKAFPLLWVQGLGVHFYLHIYLISSIFPLKMMLSLFAPVFSQLGLKK